MAKNGFSAGEALQFGWQATKNKFWFFSAMFLVIFIFALVLSVAMNALKSSSAAGYMLISLFTTIFNIFVSIGIITITLAVCDDKPIDVFDFFSNTHLILKYFAASIIYGIIVFLGCIFFIIPGIILAIRLQFFTYLLVDQQLGPIQALKKSAELTKSCTFSLFSFGILIMLINFFGVLCFGFGLFVSMPTTLIALAYVYKKLLAQNENIEKVTSAAN
ncbi:MAG: hypothetical protein V1747_09985 [Candidatus Omnitrophota bacterium]